MCALLEKQIVVQPSSMDDTVNNKLGTIGPNLHSTEGKEEQENEVLHHREVKDNSK